MKSKQVSKPKTNINLKDELVLSPEELLIQLKQREAELSLINSVQQAIMAEMDLQEIYDLVGDKIRELFNAQVVGIYTIDQDKNTEYFNYLYEDGERIFPKPRGLDKMRQLLVETKALILINEKFPQKIAEIIGVQPKAVPGTKLPKSILFVPMVVRGDVRGYVSLQNLDKEHAFSEAEVRLLSTLTNSMSSALENARLFNETEQNNAELAVINSVQEGLVAEMDMQGIYDLVGDRIRNLFNAQSVTIVNFNQETNKEHFEYNYENGVRFYPKPREIDTFRKKIIKTKAYLLINKNFLEEVSAIMKTTPKAVHGTKLPKSVLYVPLMVNDFVNGYVSIQNVDIEHAFSDADVRLLSTLANSMSVALENARLFNETEQRNAELAVINSVQEGLVAEMDMQGIYDLVGDKIRSLFDAQVTGIYSFNHDSQMEHFHYLFEDGARLYPESRPLNKIRKWLIKNVALLLVNEDADNVIYNITGEKGVAVPGTRLPKSMLFVPLIVGSVVKGCVSLQNLDRENAFSDADVRLLSTLANSMSVALENARLFNEAEQRNAELAMINSVQEGLVAEMDMQGIYDLVGDKIRDLFDAQVTAIVTFNHNDKTEHFTYLFEDGGRYFPASRPYDNVREKIITERKTLILDENAAQTISEINGKPHKPVPGTKAAKSALFVPMHVGGTVLGYVTLQNSDRDNAFSESDVSLLNTLVNSMTVALENARLFNETTRLLAETEQRNAEFAIINSVQEGLVREMDMQAIYSLVGSRICEVLNTQTLIIRTFNHDTGLETWEYAIENNEPLISEPRPFIWANQHLIKTKESLLINENFVATAVQYGDKDKGVTEGLPPKSAIFVPMNVGGIIKGSVSLQNVEKENAFTESDVRLLSTLTNSMSVALENARLFNETTRLLSETEQRATELQTVNNISRAMVSQLEFDSLINLVGEQMRETFKADIVYLALHNRKTDMLHFPYLYGETAESRPFANGITEKIILNQEPLLINNDLDVAYTKIKADVKGQMVQSYLGVPIITGSKSIGVISVQSTALQNRFDEYDQRLLSTIAANLGIAIQNAEAYQKLQAALTELKAAQQQLVQSEKMASLGELTAGIAHEIQNPLNFVNNFSEVSGELLEELEDEVKPKPDSEVHEIITDLKQNLDKINHHGKRASSIVKGMLDHSRTSSGTKELTDINVLADEYLRLAYHGHRAKDRSFNASFKTYLEENLPQTSVIAQDFGRVILNLINNAFYAVSRKEKTATDAYVPMVSIRTKSIDGLIEIEVKDNGDGIPKDISDKIFQPFFTTKPSGEGTGLGLSLAYDIVTGHGGQLTVNSKKGSYTTFKILLPITAE